MRSRLASTTLIAVSALPLVALLAGCSRDLPTCRAAHDGRPIIVGASNGQAVRGTYDNSSAAKQGEAPVAALPFYVGAELTPLWLDPEDDEVHEIAPFAFVDQTGAPIGTTELDGKVYVASFIFTSCRGICPRMVGNLLRVQAAYADDPNVILISHSVTPELDTVPVLARYATEKGIDPNRWHLVTGDKAAIYSLARASYFADAGVEADAFLHTETVYLVDGRRRIRGVYNGLLPLDMDRLIEDIATLGAAG